jgi:hypothetical protein
VTSYTNIPALHCMQTWVLKAYVCIHHLIVFPLVASKENIKTHKPQGTNYFKTPFHCEGLL